MFPVKNSLKQQHHWRLSQSHLVVHALVVLRESREQQIGPFGCFIFCLHQHYLPAGLFFLNDSHVLANAIETRFEKSTVELQPPRDSQS